MDQRNKNASFTWIYIVGILLSLGMLGLGAYLAGHGHGWVLLAAGFVSLVAAIISWPISVMLSDLSHSTRKRHDELSTVLTDRLQQVSVLLNMISEQQLLSDRAKSVAFREKDRDALRRAIQEEIAKHDFEAALVLAGEIEAVFGYKQEADRVREEIQNRRQDAVNKQISDGVGTIERHIRAEAWADAQLEAERIAKSLPNSEVAQRIPHEVLLRRDAHKKSLIDSLTEAEIRKDYDAAMEILKRLDSYLTPAEAEGLQEQARGILKHKLQTLGNQFVAAYQEKSPEAVRIGEEILRDFPNTRIAQEVKEKMDALRARPSAPAVPTPA